jgi:hypothetical protein
MALEHNCRIIAVLLLLLHEELLQSLYLMPGVLSIIHCVDNLILAAMFMCAVVERCCRCLLFERAQISIAYNARATPKQQCITMR